MNRTQPFGAHRARWPLAALLAVAAATVVAAALLVSEEMTGFLSAVAAAAVLLALAALVAMQDARRRTFVWMAALAPLLFIVAAVVHNLEYAITGVEEPTFILLAILGGPALLLAGVAGLLWTAVRDRHSRRMGDAHAAR